MTFKITYRNTTRPGIMCKTIAGAKNEWNARHLFIKSVCKWFTTLDDIQIIKTMRI